MKPSARGLRNPSDAEPGARREVWDAEVERSPTNPPVLHRKAQDGGTDPAGVSFLRGLQAGGLEKAGDATRDGRARRREGLDVQRLEPGEIRGGRRGGVGV